MENINESLKFKTHNEVVFTEIEDEQEAVLLHIETKMYYTLNKTGMEIWKMIENSLTLGEMVNTLRDNYNINREKSCSSIQKIIEDLLKEKLIMETE